MNISKAAFEILLDTLKGSLRIADNANIFFYTSKTRVELFDKLLEAMQNESIGEVGEEDEI